MSPVDMSEKERQERIESLLRQREQLRLSINKLEEMRNQYGANVPLEILTQLDEKQKQLEEVERELEELLQESEPSPPPHVPFTNREDEMELVLSSYAPAYFLLDAPAGYGKTELMQELKKRFEERGWVCAYVSVEEKSSYPGLIAALAQELDLDYAALNPEIPAGLSLGGALRQREDIADKGLVLLIDLDKKPPLDIVKEVLQELIPQVQESLRTLEFFASEHNRFRAILAGRHLAGKVREDPLPLRILRLSPFDYKVIRDSATRYLPGHTKGAINQISAHLLHMTGGHPGCMASVLEIYKRAGPMPDRFLKLSGESVWGELVKRAVNEVREGIPDHRLRETLDRLSIFRYLDYAILRRMIKDGEITGTVSEHGLADELTATYLLTWKGRLLQDDITRRLLAIRLRHEKPQKFVTYCQQARDTCSEHLREPNVQMPEMWAIEYLFQSLQQHADAIQDPAKRAEIRETFLEEDVPTALRMLVDERNIPAESIVAEQNALKQALERDWEFRFTVNYYLREDQYDDGPCNELQKYVNRFFKAKRKEASKNGSDSIH